MPWSMVVKKQLPYYILFLNTDLLVCNKILVRFLSYQASKYSACQRQIWLLVMPPVLSQMLPLVLPPDEASPEVAQEDTHEGAKGIR